MTKILRRILPLAAAVGASACLLAQPAWAAGHPSAPSAASAAHAAPAGAGGAAGAADQGTGFGEMLQAAGFAGQTAYSAMGGVQQIANQGAEGTRIAQKGFDRAFEFARFMMGG